MPEHRPRLKIARRLNVSLPGLTRKDHERRPYPPGQHGAVQSRRRRKTLFARRLEEKQKVRFNYGVTEGQMRRYMAEARRLPGVTGHSLLMLLERRLDNVVFRLGLAPTIRAARQLVGHGHVRVNGQRVDRPSYATVPGDVITLSDRARERPSIKEWTALGPVVRLPSYLAIDPDDHMCGRVIGSPVRDDVPFPVDHAAIVELYAS